MSREVFCTVQVNNKGARNILTMLLTLARRHPNATCVVACINETRLFIEAFPSDIALNIRYRELMPHIHIAKATADFIWTLKDTYQWYGPFTYISPDVMVTNEITIPNNIVEQGIGFIKHTYGVLDTHTASLYSTFLLYIGNEGTIDMIENQFYDLDYAVDGIGVEAPDSDTCNEYFRKFEYLPYNLSITEGVEHFLSGDMFLGTQNFFAYENSWKLEELDEHTLSRNGTNVCVFLPLINSTLGEPVIRNAFAELVAAVLKRDSWYVAIVNMRLTNDILSVHLPSDKGFAHWDRTNSSRRLHRLLETITDNSVYFTKSKNSTEYLSVSGHIITDKPSDKWLSNGLFAMSGAFLSNYDDSLIPALCQTHLWARFLVYCPEYFDLLNEYHASITEKPIDRTETIYDTPFPEYMEEEDYKMFMKELQRHKFMKVGANTHYIAEALACGVVLAVDKNSALTKLYELEDNKHYVYIEDVESIDDDTWKSMSNSCLEYYDKNNNLKAIMKRLCDHILVRHV